MSGTAITLDDLLRLLEFGFVIEGNMDAIPMDKSQELLYLVAATKQGIVNITLRKRDD